MVKQPPKKAGGWFEEQVPTITKTGVEPKAPIHYKIAVKNCLEQVLRRPMVQVRVDNKPKGYWTYEQTLCELKDIITQISHFPTQRELKRMKKSNLAKAILEHGGFPKFRELCGVKGIRKPDGYWTEETITEELKKITTEIGHFPKRNEFQAMGQSGLHFAMCNYGGINYFRQKLGSELLRVADGYWTDKTILEELKKITTDMGRFPNTTDFIKMKRNDLVSAITKHGGTNKFRELLDEEPLYTSDGYWTDETIIEQLKELIAKTGCFPLRNELYSIGMGGLANAISRHGGINKFRGLLNYNLNYNPAGYWTYENTLKELKQIIAEINHFPLQEELAIMKRADLSNAIRMWGGFNIFRSVLGYDFIKRPDGYWNYDSTLNELELIISKVGFFPSTTELRVMNRPDLEWAMRRFGGINKFRELLGYPASLHEQYLAESASYSVKRGKNTEMFVKTFLIEWCKANKHTEPAYNKRLGMHSILEFVCSVGKTIGIDVVNTKDKSGHSIRRKYRKKNYHKYVDELWIVVFSNIFTEKDYLKFNNESPDNVRVMPIDVFLKELDISTDEHLASKIDAYNNCTFRTKDEFVKRHLNRSIEDYV